MIDKAGLVYSTEWGSMCPACNRPVGQCVCKQKKEAPAGDGIVRVSRQTQGRKGKGVTVITGIPLEPEPLSQLASELKSRCGCGGTVKDGVIEIQGEHRDKLVELLQKKGWTVKKAGG